MHSRGMRPTYLDNKWRGRAAGMFAFDRTAPL